MSQKTFILIKKPKLNLQLAYQITFSSAQGKIIAFLECDTNNIAQCFVYLEKNKIKLKKQW